MVNKTGLPLSYKQASRSFTAAGQPNDIVGLCSPQPLLFSCDDETLSSVNKCQVKIGNSLWSAPVVMDVVGMALAVQVDRADNVGEVRTSTMAYDLGVDIKYVEQLCRTLTRVAFFFLCFFRLSFPLCFSSVF